MVEALHEAGRQGLPARGRVPKVETGTGARDLEEGLSRLVQAMTEQVRKKRALLASLTSATSAQADDTGAIATSAIAAAVKKQADTMMKHRDAITLLLPLGRLGAGVTKVLGGTWAQSAVHTTGQVVSRSVSPPKTCSKGAALVKIKDPLGKRVERELKEARQELVQQASKHALEQQRLRKQLAEARVEVNLHKLELQHPPSNADTAGARREHELTEMCRVLEQRCHQLQASLLQAQRTEPNASTPNPSTRPPVFLLPQGGNAGLVSSTVAVESATPPTLLALQHGDTGTAGQVEAGTQALHHGPRNVDDDASTAPRPPAWQAGAVQQDRQTDKVQQDKQAQEELPELVRVRTELYSMQVREQELQARVAQLTALVDHSRLPHALPLSLPSVAAAKEKQAHVEEQGPRAAANAKHSERKVSTYEGVECGVDKELEQAATSLEALDLTSSIQQSAQRHVRAAQDRAEALEQLQLREKAQYDAQLEREKAQYDAQLFQLRLASQTLQAALEVLDRPPPGPFPLGMHALGCNDAHSIGFRVRYACVRATNAGRRCVDTVVCFKAERRQHAHDAEHLREERIASERRYAEAKRQREASEEMLRRAEDQLAVLRDGSCGLLTHPTLPL